MTTGPERKQEMPKPGNKQLQPPVSDSILSGLEKLQTHHGKVLEQDQIDIFVDRLKNYTKYQVDTAMQRCLDECDFMPKLPEVRARIPEQRYPAENPGRFVVHERPLLDEIRAIVLETYPKYWDLDPIKDKQVIHDLFAAANRERYRRMGIDPDNFRARKARA